MVNIVSIIIAVVLAVLGVVLGTLNCKILNKIPAKWLCDYDEEPSEELLSGKRFSVKPYGITMSIVLAVAYVVVTLVTGVSAELVPVVLLFEVLILISASDRKYTIIPDQFTIAVAVISLIFAVLDLFTAQNFITSWYAPIIGGVCGALVLIVIDFLCTLILKKDGFGYGDVKLMGALGIMFGWKFIVLLLVLASFVAVIHFLVLVFSGKARRGVYMPMGPYICIAAAIVITIRPFTDSIVNAYMTLLQMNVLP